jgi:hypothetical protein
MIESIKELRNKHPKAVGAIEASAVTTGIAVIAANDKAIKDPNIFIMTKPQLNAGMGEETPPTKNQSRCKSSILSVWSSLTSASHPE